MLNKTRFNHDPQICRQCKGLCCQGHPGAWVNLNRFMNSFLPQVRIAPEQFEQRLHELSLTVRDYDGVPVPVPFGSVLPAEQYRLSTDTRTATLPMPGLDSQHRHPACRRNSLSTTRRIRLWGSP